MLTDYLYGWLTEGEVSTIAAQHEGRGQKIYGFFSLQVHNRYVNSQDSS